MKNINSPLPQILQQKMLDLFPRFRGFDKESKPSNFIQYFGKKCYFRPMASNKSGNEKLEEIFASRPEERQKEIYEGRQKDIQNEWRKKLTELAKENTTLVYDIK